MCHAQVSKLLFKIVDFCLLARAWCIVQRYCCRCWHHNLCSGSRIVNRSHPAVQFFERQGISTAIELIILVIGIVLAHLTIPVGCKLIAILVIISLGTVPTVWLIAFVACSWTAQALGVHVCPLWQLLSTVLKALKCILGIGSNTIILVRIIFIIIIIGVLKAELHQAVHVRLLCALVLETSTIVIGSLENASTHQGIFFVLLLAIVVILRLLSMSRTIPAKLLKHPHKPTLLLFGVAVSIGLAEGTGA